ncbi:MAG TPA: hypothetical protein VNC11_08020 [Gemmatimonadaceae bacterium]|jgi:hypothetical protein|nr:hypothetical protein [Gemmatimonadaceae bacterium]
MIQQLAPVAPAAPGQVVVTLPGAGGASAIYRGFRAQREELANQQENLQDTRGELMRELEQLPQNAPGRAGIEARIAGIDARIAAMDKQIADADAQVAKAAAVPGAIVEPPRIVRSGPPEEIYIIGTVFTFVCLIPIVIAWTRRLWKRGSVVVTSIPKEISERLARLEQSADATALEVERIGEGQRFLTRIFTEGDIARALNAPVGATIDRKIGDAG